jgi:putative tricarboxylic transport membrane protein
MNIPSAVRFRIPRDVWIGISTMVFAGLYWNAADGIAISPLDGVINAGALPKALAYAMMLFSLLLILRALITEMMYLRAARRAVGPPADRPEEEGSKAFSVSQHLKAFGVLVIGVAYLLALPWLGYIVSATLLITVMSIYIGARASAYTLGVAVAVALTFYLLFVQLLDIPLPAGIWPDLFG